MNDMFFFEGESNHSLVDFTKGNCSFFDADKVDVECDEDVADIMQDISTPIMFVYVDGVIIIYENCSSTEDYTVDSYELDDYEEVPLEAIEYFGL